MADPFSIAASALAVAGAGIKLADTLKSYINSVRKAEKHLKPIVDNVQLTSDVLNHIGELLKDEDVTQHYKPSLLTSTDRHLHGCRRAFEDLNNFVLKLLKPEDNGKILLSTAARFTFKFKREELDVLQVHLERFKSSLDLVLGVLNLISSTRLVLYGYEDVTY